MNKLFFVVVAPLALAACPPPPADVPPDPPPAGFTPAQVPAAPQVLDLGGDVLTAPKVAAVTFAGDPLADLVDAFLPQLQPSGFWTAVTSEYGVGALTVSSSLQFAAAAPSALSGDDLLGQMTDGFAADFGTPDDATMYMVVIPDGTQFSDFGECCQDFDGEHFAADVGGTTIALAVVCSCPGFDGPDVTDDDQLTTVISHELAEAATDPFDNPAFAATDDDHVAWSILSGGEIADLCDLSDESIVSFPGIDHAVQRIWSNQAAKNGADPCVPVPAGQVYFQSVPVLEDQIDVDDGFGGTVTTLGKKLAVGETGTIEVKLSSAAEVDAWNVDAFDATLTGTPGVDLQLDKTRGNNGDTLTLTVTLLSVDANIGGALFIIDSTAGPASSISVGLIAP